MAAVSVLLSLVALASANIHVAPYPGSGALARRTSASAIPVAQYSAPFSGKTKRSDAKRASLTAARGGNKAKTAHLDGSDFDEEYLTDVTIGGQTFPLIVDSGSSDTWVVQKNFSCHDLQGNPVSEATCSFGSAGFDVSASKTFKPFPGVSFNITYGDGEFLSGPVGYDTVEVAGMKVKKQEIGVPNFAAWNGDGVNSGLMGFAFPLLTSVYNTTDPTKASRKNQLPYDPFFVTAYKEKKVHKPYFAMALNRGTFDQQLNDTFDANLGYLAFGGLPAKVPVEDTAVTIPIQGISTTTGEPSSGSNAAYLWYTVDVESYTFPGSAGLDTASNSTIIDSGTTLNYVPTAVANAYANAFNPPAQFSDAVGGYVVDCNTTVPEFHVTLAGVTFPIDGRDQLLPLTETSCLLGTQDGGAPGNGNIFILGDTFMHNVVTAFDPINAEVTLVQRKTY